MDSVVVEEEVLSVNRLKLPVPTVAKKILFHLNLVVIVQYFAEIVSGNSARIDNQLRLHVKKARYWRNVIVNQGGLFAKRFFESPFVPFAYPAKPWRSGGSFNPFELLNSYCRNGSGLTRTPFCLISKWTWGPVVLPVKPTDPIIVFPATTLSPGFTETLFICA